ncbi:MAG: phosphotransferase family protein [Microthrixaceae bacterium]
MSDTATGTPVSAGGPTASKHAPTEHALAELLAANGWVNPNVTVTGAASVGAQRSTLLVDIDSAGQQTRAVAQISSGVIAATPATVEAAVIRLAAAEGVPTPRVLAATDSLPGSGQPAMVVSHEPGLSIPRRVLRSVADLGTGEALAADCGAALATLHRRDVSSAPSDLDRLRLDDPFGDYCDDLAAKLDLLPQPHPAIRLGVEWLRRHPPSPPSSPTLVHADFRTGNLLVHEGRLSAVLDWELAHVGDPMEDVAYLCLRTWRFGNDHLPVGGFGTLRALRAAYESGGGVWRDDAFAWWMAARTAWWACGLAAQAAAFTTGLTDSIVLAASGRRVPELEYDLLNLIDPHHRREP